MDNRKADSVAATNGTLSAQPDLHDPSGVADDTLAIKEMIFESRALSTEEADFILKSRERSMPIVAVPPLPKKKR
jgi:hypothetical protein